MHLHESHSKSNIRAKTEANTMRRRKKGTTTKRNGEQTTKLLGRYKKLENLRSVLIKWQVHPCYWCALANLQCVLFSKANCVTFSCNFDWASVCECAYIASAGSAADQHINMCAYQSN